MRAKLIKESIDDIDDIKLDLISLFKKIFNKTPKIINTEKNFGVEVELYHEETLYTLFTYFYQNNQYPYEAGYKITKENKGDDQIDLIESEDFSTLKEVEEYFDGTEKYFKITKN